MEVLEINDMAEGQLRRAEEVGLKYRAGMRLRSHRFLHQFLYFLKKKTLIKHKSSLICLKLTFIREIYN